MIKTIKFCIGTHVRNMGGSPGDVSEEPVNSPTLPSLHLRHSPFSNPSVALPTSQLILQPFRCLTYITGHSRTLLSFLLRHRLCPFSNPSVALPKSQLILQPFRCFTYITGHSRTLLSLLLRHRLFTYLTRRTAHGPET